MNTKQKKNMDSFLPHSAFDRSNDNKTIVSTAHRSNGTNYGSQIIEPNRKAIWIFNIRKNKDTSMCDPKCAIGLVEESQTKNNRFYGIVGEFNEWHGVPEKILETDGQYYCYHSAGYFLSNSSDCATTAYGFNPGNNTIIMQLSSGILKFEVIGKMNCKELANLELREAFRLDSSKKYKLGVYLSGKGEIEMVESSYQSITSWKNEHIERLQQEEKEEYTKSQERIELQKIAKKEEKLRKIAEKLDTEKKLKTKGEKNQNNKNIELDLNAQELRRYKRDKKIQSNHNWTTLLTVLIALFSAIGSIALTDSLGLENEQNGAIAVGMGCFSLVVGICKIYISWRATFILDTGSDDLEENYNNMWKSYALKMKAIAVFIATITDIVFDVFQGIAAIQNQEYTNNAFFVLVVSTWIGVGDEVAECFIEIFFMSLQEIDKCEISFCIGFLLWSITESIMGCYLLSTYDDEMLRLIGMSVEINLIIFSILFMALFIYWNHTKKI